jgi:hypothetical protein
MTKPRFKLVVNKHKNDVEPEVKREINQPEGILECFWKPSQQKSKCIPLYDKKNKQTLISNYPDLQSNTNTNIETDLIEDLIQHIHHNLIYFFSN